MSLPDEWVSRIFQRLDGIYGQQFRGKYSRIENGTDIGIAMAKSAWADELRGFRDFPEAIAYALQNLPTEKAPNAIEFRELCRHAPRKQEAVAAIEHKPTLEEIERSKQLAKQATKAVTAMEYDGLLWAKRPKSQKAISVLFDAKKERRKFPALAEIFDNHVRDGVCDETGKILRRFDGQAWVKA